LTTRLFFTTTERAELKADLAESARILEDQRRHNMRVQERVQGQNRVLDDLGLDESEALEYALMLSRETAQSERDAGMSRGREFSADEGVFVEDERLEGNVVPLPDPAAVDLDAALDPEDATSVAFHTGSLVAAGKSNGDQSTSISSAGREADIDSIFPTLSSSLGSSPRRSPLSHSPTTSWAQFGKASASAGTSVSARRTPNASAGPSSLHSHASSSQVGGLEGLEDMDEDMRYALELSLAEAESKRMGV